MVTLPLNGKNVGKGFNTMLLMREKDLSLELLQTIGLTMELLDNGIIRSQIIFPWSDHQASKMESFQQHDDSINAIKRAIDKKDTSNVRNRDMKCFRCEKSGLWK